MTCNKKVRVEFAVYDSKNTKTINIYHLSSKIYLDNLNCATFGINMKINIYENAFILFSGLRDAEIYE